jgi:hypothetical protein
MAKFFPGAIRTRILQRRRGPRAPCARLIELSRFRSIASAAISALRMEK